MPDLAHEARHHPRIVCGIDEAGRGPWAGPVVAACVRIDMISPALLAKLDDSKKLPRAKREALFMPILNECQVSIGEASAEEIDRLNIWKATELAMQRAYHTLGLSADVALVDGNRAPSLGCEVIPLVGGDGISASIAAASIIAKVTRDRLMDALEEIHPGYGFARHAGYGTRAHHDALKKLGPCAIHRKSFAPIRALLQEDA